MGDMERSLFAYEVTKSDLIHTKVDNLIGIIDRLREEGKKHRGCLQIFCSAYDDVPDELNTIPKFRKFIRKIATLRPYFLYYLQMELDPQVHVIGCLGDVESYQKGERLSNNDIVERGIHPDEMPRMLSVIRFDKDLYIKMKQSIQKLCQEINDPDSEAELMEFLEYHKPESL